MKVLVVTSLFPNQARPGLGISVRRRTLALAKHCEVRVVAPCVGNVGPARQEWDGVEAHYPWYPHVPKLGVLVDGPAYLACAAPAVRRVRRGFDFDVIDSHFVYPDGFAAAWLGRMFHRPVVLTARGTDVNKLCFWWPTRAMARMALRRVDSLIAVSSALKERMVTAGAAADKVRVIPNGVDTTVFHPGDRQAERRALGLPLEQTVLFSAGSLIEAKGFDCLIEGLAQLPEAHAPHLYIAGPPCPYQQTLERLAADRGVGDRVKFVGHLPPAEMPAWYRAADFFCFGSLREGCPNVVIEAAACGTPVVSTTVGGIPDLVEEGRTGLLFAPRSAEGFARALGNALSRDWDRADIAHAGSQRSWAQVAAEAHALLERTVAKHKERRTG